MKYIMYLDYLQRIKTPLSNIEYEFHIIILTQDDFRTHVKVFPNVYYILSDI